MTIPWQPSLCRKAYPLMLLLLVTYPGCRENEPRFEVISLDGKIEKIDLSSDRTGEVTVLYYNEKQGRDVLGTGRVTPETEIMINGALATLKDLRIGDRVRGEVRVEKKGQKKKQIALKIYVDRPTPVGGEGG